MNRALFWDIDGFLILSKVTKVYGDCLKYLNIRSIIMKIDRLLGITIYLLNHDIVNTKVLADRFEVSVRTIIRDAETLSLAGIPITTMYGTNGGYKILDSFKMNNQLVDGEDCSYILTALQGLNSGYKNKRI